MRAMRIHRYGDAAVIQSDDVPTPAPGPGEVLVHVAATSFNPSDIGVRRGLLRDVLPIDLPYTLGGDVSGTVAATGPDVTAPAVGDRVFGRVPAAAADYVVAPAGLLATAPESIPLAHAAAVPIAGLTAWQAVFEHARLTPGDRVLINGAGGGVGGFAVQLAKHAGAYVIATASARSAGAVREQGADEIIDYTADPVTCPPVDAILNLADLRPEQAADLRSLLRPDGVLVSITVPVGVHFVARNDPAQLTALAALIDAGVVRVDIAGARPLTDLPAVHRAAEAGHLRGKTILLP